MRRVPVLRWGILKKKKRSAVGIPNQLSLRTSRSGVSSRKDGETRIGIFQERRKTLEKEEEKEEEKKKPEPQAENKKKEVSL